MRVLLTSGTGYIGAGVARALKAAGHKVAALARSDESKRKLESAGIEAIQGDIKKPETVIEACTTCDAIVHTAFVYGAETAQIEDSLSNYLIQKLAGTKKKIIYTSGVWVYGPCGDLFLTEEAPLVPVPLVAWRPAVEQAYLSAAKSGLHSIVIRPAMVYGGSSKGIFGEMIESARKNHVVRYVGTGTNNWSLIHVDDLGRLYVAALEKAPAGSVYNGSAGGPMTVHDIAIACSEIVGIPGKVQSWPLEEARKVLGAYADALATNVIISSAKAEKELDWKPTEPGLAKAYAIASAK
jgi:nucleoside-diphosphate-sugar epimerase